MLVRRVGLALALLLPASVAVHSAPGLAAPFVNTTVDELNADGDCSLREAVESVNTGSAVDACGATSGPIVLPAGIFDVATDLVVSVDLTVRGAGAGATTLAWSGSDIGDGVFDLRTAGAFTLEDLTITGSSRYHLNRQCNNASPITVNDAELSGAKRWAINACDGPIAVNRSLLEIGDVGFTYLVNNNSGSVTVTDSLLRGTGTGSYYGINTAGGDVVLTRSTITKTETAIDTSSGNVTMVNATLSSDDYRAVRTFAGVITLESSTITGSYTNGALVSNATASLTNSIITGGPGDTCLVAVTSGGFNIADDASCGLTEPSDRPNSDPLLSPLTDNGGATPTMLPLVSSPAIDTGGSCPAVDQRGLPRPSDGDNNGSAVCDRGAVEVQERPLTPTTSTPETVRPAAAPVRGSPSFTG